MSAMSRIAALNERLEEEEEEEEEKARSGWLVRRSRPSKLL
jgi:hypothetical protein